MSKESSRRRAEEFQKLLHEDNDVVVIEPKVAQGANVRERQENVGAYCRVSTQQDEQVGSLETQKAHYEEMVTNNPNWNLVGIYADPGISATSMVKRKNLLRLIDDCKSGKVTMIITKSVTRFARNVVDCVSTCRMLKSLSPPVGVFFETENIFTLTANSETFLNFFSTFAQAESETKSASIKWGIRSRFAKGIPRIADLYGYIRNGKNLEPDPLTSNYVRAIYQLRANGYSLSEIIKWLHSRDVPSPLGKNTWSPSSLRYILTNERYAGDVLMQKTVVIDVFSHKSIKNKRIVPSYWRSNYHEAIVSKELWDIVQATFLNENLSMDDLILLDATPTTISSQKYYPVMLKGAKKNVF